MPDVYKTSESNCMFGSSSNKIIIYPNNNPTLLTRELRNTYTSHNLGKSEAGLVKHDFSCTSTQYTRENNMDKNLPFCLKKKESIKDQQSTKTIRLKKTVFKAPAFLKNKETIKPEK